MPEQFYLTVRVFLFSSVYIVFNGDEACKALYIVFCKREACAGFIKIFYRCNDAVYR
ncbi:hypothetical protein D3C85_1546440 [compost metagenome]|jgi:hypothetical protein